MNIRFKKNKLYNKKTIMYKELDILEKIVTLADLQGVIATMEINLEDYKLKNGDNKKVAEVEKMLNILKNTEAYVYELFEQGSNSERYAFEVTKDNLRLRFENDKLNKELETIKNNLQ